MLYHHEKKDAMQCIDIVSGAVCSGYPNNAYNGMTSNTPGRAAVVGTKLFYRRSDKDTGFGLFCFDTATTAACGAQPFFVARTVQEITDRGSEPVAVNGKVYAVVDDHKLYCFDPATATNCSGYPKDTALAGTVSAPSATGKDRGLMDLAVDGTRIYLSYANDFALADKNSAPTGYLHCFDTATGASCWASYLTWSLSADDGFGYALFFRKNAQGARTGVCLGSVKYRLCTDLNGNNRATTDTQDGMWGAGRNESLAISATPPTGRCCVPSPSRTSMHSRCGSPRSSPCSTSRRSPPPSKRTDRPSPPRAPSARQRGSRSSAPTPTPTPSTP